MKYKDLKLGDTIRKDDEVYLEKEFRWTTVFFSGHKHSNPKVKYRRPIKVQSVLAQPKIEHTLTYTNYRMLEVGEKTNYGDQLLTKDGMWVDLRYSMGSKVGTKDYENVRRPIPGEGFLEQLKETFSDLEAPLMESLTEGVVI